MLQLFDTTPSVAFLLAGAGALAGLTNAIAGGGTFFTFPVLMAAGLPPVVANASNAVAVWPGHALAVVDSRNELSRIKVHVGPSVVIALLGGVVGFFLLVAIDNTAFAKAVPFLILFATLLFAFGRGLSTWFASRAPATAFQRRALVTRFCEFCFAVYGGFFGAGLGVMLMAGLLMLGVHDLYTNNALKNLLASVVTSVSVAIFAVTGLVSWSHTLVAFVGAIAGGFLGARAARLLSAVWLRRVVVAVGLVLSVYYSYRYYG